MKSCSVYPRKETFHEHASTAPSHGEHGSLQATYRTRLKRVASACMLTGHISSQAHQCVEDQLNTHLSPGSLPCPCFQHPTLFPCQATEYRETRQMLPPSACFNAVATGTAFVCAAKENLHHGKFDCVNPAIRASVSLTASWLSSARKQGNAEGLQSRVPHLVLTQLVCARLHHLLLGKVRVAVPPDELPLLVRFSCSTPVTT